MSGLTTKQRSCEPTPAWSLGHAPEVPPGDTWLTPVEREAQSRFVVPKRRADWRLGRWTAKGAVCEWVRSGGLDRERPTSGRAEFPELTRDRVGIVARSPEDGFPLVEGAGSPAPRLSLAHRGALAAAVVAPSGTAVGCDLERVEPRSRGFAADWFTAAEQRVIERGGPEHHDELVSLTWSAKESALKAIGEGLRVDTRTVRTDLGAPGAPNGPWGRVRVDIIGGARLTGWWRLLLGYVLVVVADGSALECPPRRLWPNDQHAGSGGARNYGADPGRIPLEGRLGNMSRQHEDVN